MPVYEEKGLVNGQKRWFIRTYVTDEYGNRKQITRHNKEWLGLDGKRDAIAEENRLQNKKIIHSQKNNITYKDVVNRFLEIKQKETKESTYYTYENAILCIIQKLPFYNKKICNYSATDNEYFRNYLENSNYKLEYKNKLHNIQNGILDIAVNEFGLERNYERLLGPFKEKKEQIVTDDEKIRYITYSNFIKILNNIDDYLYNTIFYLLFFTGMRKGEILALTWEDIDFKNSIIKITKTYTNKTKSGIYKITNTKNIHNRVIQLDIKTKKRLLEFYDIESKQKDFSINDFVFGSKKPISTTTLSNKWKKAFKNTNIQPITIHEIRHSHVSFLINEYIKKGNTDTTKFFLMMSSRMGHTLKVMQETYMHLFPGFQNEIIDLIDDYNIQKQDQKQDQKK